MTVIARSKGGTEERQEDVRGFNIPDLWHIAMWLKDNESEINIHNHLRGQSFSDAVLECWHLCHDLVRHVEELERERDDR